MRTTIRMSDELARQAKSYAKETGRTFTQFIEQAVVKALGKGHKPQSRKRIKLPTYGGDGIVGGLTLEEAIARAQLEEDLALVGVKSNDSDRR
jgi:hypothetical protein